MRPHPLLRIPRGLPRVAVLLLLLAGTVVTARITNAPALRTDAAPAGILSLELAGTSARAQAVVSDWRGGGLIGEARRHVRTDYPFILFYSTCLALACAWTGEAARWERAGNALAWGAWAAGVFDVLENLAMGPMLGGTTSAPWPQLALAASAPKWILVTAGFVFVVVAAGRALLRRR